MIECSICHTQNHHLAMTCTSCGGYLQNRVENIDLFATTWGVMERPSRTFRIIAVSQRKNFALLLAALAGIGFTFGIFWFIAAGEYTENVLNVFIAGIILGPGIGILLTFLHSILVTIAATARGISVKLKNAFAVMSYALVPVILSVLFLLPIEILTFGRFFFTQKPSPYSLKPLSYIILIGLDGICVLWTFFLMIIGTRTLLNIHWKKSLIILSISLIILSVGIVSIIRLLLPHGVS